MAKIRVRNCGSLVFAAVLFWFTALGSHGAFKPVDNFLIACGSTKNITFEGRNFVPDSTGSLFRLKSEGNSSIFSTNSSVPSPIYKFMRVFLSQASYEFDIRKKGRHWVRLYFHPFLGSYHNIESASITAVTEEFVLLNNFSFKNYNHPYLFKEYVINVESNFLTITFIPSSSAFTFINGIEVVSVPDEVFSDQILALAFSSPYKGLPQSSDLALETLYRLNVGGPSITPQNDTLGRTWENDHKYIHLDMNTSIVNVSVNPASITYNSAITPQTAPSWVYASAVAMGYAPDGASFFNITWFFTIDPRFTYLVRLHFCDIISILVYKLIFNIYVNFDIAVANFDLSTITGDYRIPYFKDLIVCNPSAHSRTISVGVGTTSTFDLVNLTVSGLEILKISNDARSLDGFSSVEVLLADGNYRRKSIRKINGWAFGASATVALILICCSGCLAAYRSKLTQGARQWLPGIAIIFDLLNYYGDHWCINFPISGYIGRVSVATTEIGRCFAFQEIVKATHGFDESLLLGVGGFGRVYMGTLESGIKVAIKRANPLSRQGLSEFQTEIKILSKVRHRHVVSLLGYCDEESEMILVYEYMANGTLRSHLYGTDFPSLPWEKRLKICIGAASGLHYLHTGAAQNIIHRDVKTTNILLDENFVAKVADFGLSKIGPETNETHVSTIVKGTFGYFDPEYIRRQQLTAKSDVYSFGVVLMEVLCARPVLKEVLPSEEVYIVDWVMSVKDKGMLEEIMDPNLAGKVNEASLKKFTEAAEKCLAQHGVDRPNMGNVLSNLEHALQLQESVLSVPESSSTKCSTVSADTESCRADSPRYFCSS